MPTRRAWCARRIARGLWQAQTPQMFRYGVLRRAFARRAALACTDEAQAVEALGLAPRLVRGSPANLKITFPDDLPLAAAILAAQAAAGALDHDDAHRQRIRRARAGGGTAARPGRRHDSRIRAAWPVIPMPTCCCTRSRDAILGALALGDIGAHFPDTDPRWKGADSRALLRHVYALVVDARLRNRQRRRDGRSRRRRRSRRTSPRCARTSRPTWAATSTRVSVKATTTERLGFTGREEGIAARGGRAAARRDRNARSVTGEAARSAARQRAASRARPCRRRRAAAGRSGRRAVRAMRSTIARPSPAPAAPSSRARAAVARVNGCFSRSTSSGGMPAPRSATSITAIAVPHASSSPRPAARRRRARCRRGWRRGARSPWA